MQSILFVIVLHKKFGFRLYYKRFARFLWIILRSFHFSLIFYILYKL